MPYIPREVVEQARQMDLLTYLRNYDPQELVHFAGNTYCTREHDSLKISNGKWYWFSQSIGGVSALDYLIKVKGMAFHEAVQQITGQAAIQPPVFVSRPKQHESKLLLLPKANRDTNQVVNYLQRRGIDREIIQFCISTGRLYESFPHHNVVVVGHDKIGKARYANLRGTDSSFKGECNGSDKRYSFSIPAQSSTRLYLFESAIDLLSYATLRKMNGMDWRKDHLLSLAGVFKNKEHAQIRIPLALTQYLADHPEVQSIRLRLDNDRTGQIAAQALIDGLSDRYSITAKVPPQGKDYNDYLCMVKGLPIAKYNERKQER